MYSMNSGPVPQSGLSARNGSEAWSGGLLLALGVLLLASCASTPTTPVSEADRRPMASIGVQPGDQLRIVFPGAPSMNSTQQVQADGSMSLQSGGSLVVKGKTPTEVEKALLEVYGPQLVVKEVSVSVETAGFPVFVSGAVLRPGRVLCRHSITVLEAIVDAGGFNEGRADLRHVRVVRKQDDGSSKTYVLDLRVALQGKAGEPFHLRPSDVVYVPERFSFY